MNDRFPYNKKGTLVFTIGICLVGAGLVLAIIGMFIYD